MTTPAPLIIPTAAPGTAPKRASTARHFAVAVEVNGTSLGAFETFGGGDTTAESPKRTVAGVRRVALGGVRDTDDVTVSRQFVYDRDHDLARQLRALVGVAEVTVTRQPLDRDGKVYGKADLFRGVLSGLTYPEVDEDSSDVAMLELMVTVDGEVG